MEAVILAGGRGERLRPLTDQLPKPMIEVGGRPVLAWILDLLHRNGATKVYVLTGYLGEMIEAFCAASSFAGMEIECVREDSPQGTAGALSVLRGRITDDFLVLYGDVFCEIDLRGLLLFHKKRNAAATLAARVTDHPQDSDLLVTNHRDEVLDILLKPHHGGAVLGNAGLFAFSPRVFDAIPCHRPLDIMHGVVPSLIGNCGGVFAYRICGYIKDMGSHSRLREVDEAVRRGLIRNGKEARQRAVFLDRDGTVVKFVPLLHRPEEISLLPGAARAIRRFSKSGFLTIMVTNQPVLARNLCNWQTLAAIHSRMTTELRREACAVLDDISVCPHHPDAGFPEENKALKIPCTCRKPATGLIDAAVERYRIDRSMSWMVGDSRRDIEAGKRAGLRTIFLGDEEKTNPQADYHCPDLAAAAEIILAETGQGGEGE